MGETIASGSQHSRNFRRLVQLLVYEVGGEKPSNDDWYDTHPGRNERSFGESGRVFVGLDGEAGRVPLLQVAGQQIQSSRIGHVNFSNTEADHQNFLLADGTVVRVRQNEPERFLTESEIGVLADLLTYDE